MYTADQVTDLINKWKTQGLSRSELAVLIADACIGWPYVWGGYGQIDTPKNREAYANRSSCPEAESAVIISKCQVLRKSKSSCDGCKWYPGGSTRFFDCRGFTRWVLQQATGWTLQGAGATSQWNDNSNWKSKGTIDNLPKDTVCCLFKKVGDKMNHTGLYIGGGMAIHCSGEVKKEAVTSKAWTHYAVPVAMEGDVPVWRPTIRKGSTGEDVVYCQQILIKLGYNLGASGADGKFGAKTQAAVKEFQAKNGLGVDGVVGPMTWEALEKADPGPDPSTTLYTVTIPHLPLYQAEALKDKYAGSTIVAEVEKGG